jgi:hypothetical protein
VYLEVPELNWTVAVPSVVPPSMNVTPPVGLTPAYPSVAVKVADWPE